MKPTFILIILIAFSSTLLAQKHETNITLGPLVSVPTYVLLNKQWKTGFGMEAMAQYNFTNRSVLLLQTSFASHGLKNAPGQHSGTKQNINIFSFRGGYKYVFGSSGWYVNGSAGPEYKTASNVEFSYLIGAGKRINLTEDYFVDAGVDYISGGTNVRLNFKALFSIWRNRKS
ncbi:outer membrane beta-barrel protein [Aridibaculum aurantiacum]|uniref:outer membrane beta-barrel protein n=1 Tax=Aridibaculum aurantiacum TaxID=2810307 RepID=UPI001A97260B|nr:outer membrane beta-barrel protein [Aridibaculum aurantiacum]